MRTIESYTCNTTGSKLTAMLNYNNMFDNNFPISLFTIHVQWLLATSILVTDECIYNIHVLLH